MAQPTSPANPRGEGSLPGGGSPAPSGPHPPGHAAALAATARSTRLTGRAAVLAVVICAIALSLAYPVREYIAQRQQIDQLLAQRQQMSAQVNALQQEANRLGQTSYIEQQAEARLGLCFPDEECFEVINGHPPSRAVAAKPPQDPWYAKLWQSVQQANQGSPR